MALLAPGSTVRIRYPPQADFGKTSLGPYGAFFYLQHDRQAGLKDDAGNKKAFRRK